MVTTLMAAASPMPTASAAAGRPPGTAGRAAVSALAGGRTGPAAVTAARPGAASRQLLLINGDRVLTSGAGHALIVPAGRSGLAGSVLSLTVGGSAHDIPAAALPYLGHGLDSGLFDVKALMTAETRGRLPVQITYRGHVPALPGITITQSGGGTATGYLTASSAATFGTALDRQFIADHAAGSYGTDGLFAGGTMIALAGTARPGPVPHPHFPMRTLTVRGFNLAGKPDTGDVVLLFNVDNTDLVDLIASPNTFFHGVAKYSVPSGHYFAVGFFLGPGPQFANRVVVLPQFSVSGDRAVTVRESAASSKITMVTPRPASVLDTNLWLLRTGTAGLPAEMELLILGSSPVWISPTSARPTAGTLRVSANQHLESPPGPGVPYEYTLSFTGPAGTIPAQRHVLRPGDLAVVNERFFQPVKSSGGWTFHGSLPGTGPNSPDAFFGFIEPFGPVLGFPGRLTEYAGGTGSAGMEWSGQYDARTGYQAAGSSELLRPGEQRTESWNADPLHPVQNARLNPEPPVFEPYVPSAVRAGDTLSLDLNPFGDNQIGHRILFLLLPGVANVTGSYEIDRNGVKIAGGDAVKQAASTGEFHTSARLGSKPSTLRFSLDLSRTGTDFPLSTATQTAWTWPTAPAPGATLPPGWSCIPFPEKRRCAVEPMMTLSYQVAGLALDGSSRAGQQALGISVGHLQLARAAKITSVRVSVSFDDGKTWRTASVRRVGGTQYRATFTAPAGALVTLRTSAADAAGGSIGETITRAYQIAP